MNLDLKIQRGAYKRFDEGLTVPDDGGRYVQIVHWGDLDMGHNDNPFPEMITPSAGLVLKDPEGRIYDYVVTPDEWQWFNWSLLDWGSQYLLPRGRIEEFYTRPGNARTFARATPGSLMYVYIDLIEAHRCFTEAGSPEAGNRDVVTGRNLENPKGYEYLHNPTGGALLKVTRDLGSLWEVEALDVLKSPPPLEYVIPRPWLWFWCTQWDKFNGATRFPQIKNSNEVWGLPPAGVPAPLMSKGGRIKILKTSTIAVQNGQPYSPYRKV